MTEVLVPQLNKTMVVVMDNLNLHCSPEVRSAIESTGANLLFLPTYSPDLSLIEMFLSKMKSILRSTAPRTTEQLHDAITLAFNFWKADPSKVLTRGLPNFGQNSSNIAITANASSDDFSRSYFHLPPKRDHILKK